MNILQIFTGEEILPSNQKQIIEPAKFTYSLLGQVFEKQTKIVKDKGEEQVSAVKINEKKNKGT